MNKEPAINGLEKQAVYARKEYCYLVNHPETVKFAKRCINKRRRRKERAELRNLAEID